MPIRTSVDTADTRRNEATRVRDKHPDRIPVICGRHASCTSIPEIEKSKYLVCRDLTIGQFIFVLRKRLRIHPSHAIFIYTESGNMPSCMEQIHHLDQVERNMDGFLYLGYAAENTFGTVDASPASSSAVCSTSTLCVVSPCRLLEPVLGSGLRGAYCLGQGRQW